jgi:tight adherence protein C
MRIGERTRDLILSMADSLRSRIGVVENEKLRQRLKSAGLKSDQAMGMYSITRLAAPVLGIAVESFIRQQPVFWALTLAAIFYMLPDMWLGLKTKRRRERIRKSLPDALDLLVICVDAGLGLDQAMLRVGQELVISHPDINQEFIQINLEQMAGRHRLDAWKSAAEKNSDSGVLVVRNHAYPGGPIWNAHCSSIEQIC